MRYVLRMLFKDKAFTLVAVLTVALGIGVNTAMFSVLNTFLFRALPYPNSDRIVRVFRTSPHSQSWPHSAANFFDYREKNTVFDGMAAYNWTSPNLVQEGQMAERLQAIAVTADFFSLLEAQPATGRVFKPEEFEPGADKVVILNNPFWQRRFGGDPSIVGRRIQLDGETVEIIGVMPAGFEHPILWGKVDVWQPLAFMAERRRNRGNNFLQAIGRLKPGISIAQAQQSMALLFGNIAKENSSNSGQSLRLEPLQRSMSDDIGRKVMWFTFGLAGFVLLIACANLANLQLVRTAARSRELAVRAALGASRIRLLRQSLTESILVAFIGGAFSLLLALWGVRSISNRLFSDLPGARVTLDFRVFGFALLCAVLTGLLFGTIPAWLASRADVNQALRENARGSTAGRSQHRLRHALIVGEVAFALVLLAGAGLFLRGLQRAMNSDPGWQVDGLLTAQMSLRGEKYKERAPRTLFLSQLEDRLSNLPGVQQVAVSSSQVAFGFSSSGPFVVEGQPEPPPDKYPEMFLEPVSTHYFEALGCHLLQGRNFTAADTADRPTVLIVNETMARRFWPNENPIGKRINWEMPKYEWQEVVGVVNDLDFPGRLGEPYTRLEAFVPLAQSPPSYVTVALRTSVTPEAIGNSLRKAVADLDSTQPVHQIRTAESAVQQGVGNISLLGSLLGAFAALGLALAAIGIYGVIGYTVLQRTGEFGIRLALGAQTSDVLKLVMGTGIRLILLGSLLGAGGAYAVAKLLLALIPSLPTHEPMVLVVVSVALIFVGLLACYIPARRAAKVDPLVALRYE
jgi:predicted permease